MNKKAGEKYLSIWWFFVLAIIAGGIVIGVSAFNVANLDTKEIEADILISRVIDCIVDNGYINQEFLDGNFDIFEKCYLNEEIIDFKDNGKATGDYFLRIEVFKFENCEFGEEVKCGNPIDKGKRSFGVAAIETQCGYQEAEKSSYPGCSEKYVYVLSGEEKLILHVFAGSSQLGKRKTI